MKTQQQPWHLIGVDATLDAQASSPEGLSRQDARTRLEAHGPNRLPEPPRRSRLARFGAHFNNILIYVLLGSALVTSLLGHLTDTLVILAVVLANAVIGFVQEGKAEKAMDAIRTMLALKASILRDSERTAIPGEELVPGDVVLLEAGDKVPADLRLVRASGLQVQEAVLTGESVPVGKGCHRPADRTPESRGGTHGHGPRRHGRCGAGRSRSGHGRLCSHQPGGTSSGWSWRCRRMA